MLHKQLRYEYLASYKRVRRTTEEGKETKQKKPKSQDKREREVRYEKT